MVNRTMSGNFSRASVRSGRQSSERPMFPARQALALFAMILVLAGCRRAENTDQGPTAKPQPLIVAHRGLLLHAPENTLANFRACLELRLGFEFDVRRTRDGHLVCVHDATVDRTTDGTGKVADLTLEEVRHLDAGSWFDPKFAGEKVPTVAEIFRLIAQHPGPDFLVAVDVKVGDVEEALVRLAEKHGVLHRLLFIGKTISEPAV